MTTASIGKEFEKTPTPRVLVGILSSQQLERLAAVLDGPVTSLGGIYSIVANPDEDVSPVHIIHFHYVDSAGHWHEGIAAEYPDNGHSVVLADVIVH